MGDRMAPRHPTLHTQALRRHFTPPPPVLTVLGLRAMHCEITVNSQLIVLLWAKYDLSPEWGGGWTGLAGMRLLDYCQFFKEVLITLP